MESVYSMYQSISLKIYINNWLVNILSILMIVKWISCGTLSLSMMKNFTKYFHMDNKSTS